MSFVGPRPERPFFVERLRKRSPTTPNACVSNRGSPDGPGELSVCATRDDAEEKLRLDLYYIKNMSLPLDLLIVLKTVKIAVLGQGAR